jgi:hypothetical protein
MNAVPTGLWRNGWFLQTTLKRGANNHCACGACDGLLPAWNASKQAPLRATNQKAAGSVLPGPYSVPQP